MDNIKEKWQKVKADLKDWYQNYPYEGIEITEKSFKHLKLNKNFEIEKREMWLLEELREKKIDSKGLVLNYGISYIHYHFFDLEEKPKDVEAEKKVLFWKLKNKVPYVKEDNTIFDYYEIEDKKYILFTLDKDVVEKAETYLPDNKQFIINSETIGIYNYYAYLFKQGKVSSNKNIILINMGESITDMIFIENDRFKFIRSFEIGIVDYIKKIDDASTNILDGLTKLLTNIYIPKELEDLMDGEKLVMFDKIKDINKMWMHEIDESVKYYLTDDEKTKFEIVFMRYENCIINLDFALSKYINMHVVKANIKLKEIPYISLFGNIVKLHM